MTEKELINQLKGLKEIKPRKEWALLLKSQIFEGAQPASAESLSMARKLENWKIGKLIENLKFKIENSFFELKIQKRLAYAFATLALLIAGTFGFAQYTMPGDLLFPIKKIAEQTQQDALQVAYNRSEDLVQIVKENKTQNLDSAIYEFKSSMVDAAKKLTQDLAKNSDNDSIKLAIAEVKKIQDNQKQLETLGINIGEAKDLDNVLALLVQDQIESLDEATLTDKQQEELSDIKDLYSQEKYSEALEKILLINN